ncbi:MAG: AmmeMemoRadiSam system radical SAM enzyme [Clostridiales bacterium]|jgi:pyruvate formate lyase activating enzyme|nr:AmmeMemoRadiSam system radical SAM enzyme [Clostridiales bacterium]
MNVRQCPRTARFYETTERGLQCLLCPRGCVIPFDRTGVCGARRNAAGRLIAESYGQISSLALDPIEKKPLRHFYPGGMILSIGSYGCNLRCPFCQNYSISMGQPPVEFIPPEKIVRQAEELIPQGNIGVAFTYNEPFIAWEFMYDTAKLAHERGLVNVIVTNGYVSPEPLMELLPFIDAMNIDVKGFSDEFYAELGGTLAPVMATVEAAARHCHVELTTLILPDSASGPRNAYASVIEPLARWVAGIDEEIPLHLTRFYPRWQMSSTPPTDMDVIRALGRTAEKYLRHVHY